LATQSQLTFNLEVFMNRFIAALTLGATVFAGYASMARADEVFVEHREPVRREVIVVHHPRHRVHRHAIYFAPRGHIVVHERIR
jgi:hypothetical protein